MAVYLVEYSVGGNRVSTKVKAERYDWTAGSVVKFTESGRLVAKFLNVSAVVNTENLVEAEVGVTIA